MPSSAQTNNECTAFRNASQVCAYPNQLCGIKSSPPAEPVHLALRSWVRCQFRAIGRGHPSVFSFRRPRCRRDGHIRIEVGSGDGEFLRRRLRRVRRRRSNDIGSPRILHEHRNEFAMLVSSINLALVRPPTRDLQVDHVHGIVGKRAGQGHRIVDDLVRNEWPCRPPTN